MLQFLIVSGILISLKITQEKNVENTSNKDGEPCENIDEKSNTISLYLHNTPHLNTPFVLKYSLTILS